MNPEHRGFPSSLWHEQLGESAEREPLGPGNHTADVVVVGAGFTGLWTAYYLQQLRPELTISILDAERAGFGASGRNGGWCIAELAAGHSRWAALSDPAAATALDAAMHDTVDRIEAVIAEHEIDCDFTRGGELFLARNGGQEARLRSLADDQSSFWLTKEEALDKCGATRVRGALYIPSTAVLHPAKLVRSLADIVEANGATIFERTRATVVAPGRVETQTGSITARYVVLATEAYSTTIKGRRRSLVPLSSMMVATEPLSEAALAEIKLDDRPAFADGRFRVIYGQRTADNRLAFGGRSAPYQFGSAIPENAWYQNFDGVRETLIELFPVLTDAAITHQWGGVLGVPRNWTPSVNIDADRRLLSAGGYVGEGVAATHLAGRTMATAIAGVDDPILALPWVRKASRNWPLEPFRWLGINAGAEIFGLADRLEDRSDNAAGWASTVVKALRR